MDYDFPNKLELIIKESKKELESFNTIGIQNLYLEMYIEGLETALDTYYSATKDEKNYCGAV